DGWGVVEVVGSGGDIGGVDHRRLAAFLLQDVNPPMAVLRHRRCISGKIVADVLVHSGERAELAIGALGNVDDHVPSGHIFTPGSLAQDAGPMIRYGALFLSTACSQAVASVSPYLFRICREGRNDRVLRAQSG